MTDGKRCVTIRKEVNEMKLGAQLYTVRDFAKDTASLEKTLTRLGLS